ncbi:SWIRM domain protein [Oesophagostomum dentatum]|uniref:SWIRM domain protein n=1 Tax=Oesophagostomum dentatum TaxID=61180 RepID=A0A0B1THP7_OESDE|nr:SWIRM domain protein [Oesophagostomum dentatum]
MTHTEERSHSRRDHSSELDSESIKQLLEDGELETLRWEDDDISLRSAASNSRLPYDKLTAQELVHFPDASDSKASTNLYLFVRNKILQLWLLEPNVELTSEDAIEQLPIPFNSDRRFVRRIHGFLQRYGFINYGNFHRLASALVLTSKRKRVIIIGAGAAGIAAMKQLHYFGFDVVVLEGRKRLGGRVHTYHQKDSSVVADLGAMVVTGINGNPIVTMMRQTQCTPVRISPECPIYDEYGKLVDQRKDELVAEAFKKIGDTAAYIAHTLGVTEVNGNKLSVADAYNNILDMLELRMQRRRLKYWQIYEEILEKMKQVQNEITLYKKSAVYLAEKLKSSDGSIPLTLDSDSRLEMDILRRCYKRDLGEAIKRYDATRERFRNLETTLRNLKKQEPSEVYMNQRDRRLLDFHFANLEYVSGGTLDRLSLQHFDQEDEFQFTGSHMAIRDGYGDFLTRLVTSDVASMIKQNAVVESIKYNEKGVEVQYKTDDSICTIDGDVCLCTIPLGVLKRSVMEASDAPKFEPPLPENTIKAIIEMGFGNFNKVVLIFSRPFWDVTQNYFGHLNHSRSSRGEMFMFTAVSKAPVLIAMMAGEAANLEAPNEVIVRKAMNVLANIFGSACPKGVSLQFFFLLHNSQRLSQPVEAVITRWHKDPFACGAYAYIPCGSRGDLCDILAEPIRAQAADGTYSGEERIFFAGEHTSGRYPASVQVQLLWIISYYFCIIEEKSISMR